MPTETAKLCLKVGVWGLNHTIEADCRFPHLLLLSFVDSSLVRLAHQYLRLLLHLFYLLNSFIRSYQLDFVFEIIGHLFNMSFLLVASHLFDYLLTSVDMIASLGGSLLLTDEESKIFEKITEEPYKLSLQVIHLKILFRLMKKSILFLE